MEQKFRNSDSVMEADTISKHGASSKSLMSRKNNLKKACFLLFATVLLFSSCLSTRKGYQSLPVISRNVTLDPIKADITVDESKKLYGQSTISYFLFFRVSGDNYFTDGIHFSTDVSSGRPIKAGKLNKVRNIAAYDALQTGDYDILVHPTYEIKKVNYVLYKKYTVKVSGYGAKYSNFRTEPQKVIITSSGKEYVFPDK